MILNGHSRYSCLFSAPFSAITKIAARDSLCLEAASRLPRRNIYVWPWRARINPWVALAAVGQDRVEKPYR